MIIDNNKIILIKRVRSNGTYWVFPGGGVEKGEDKIQALKRECKEELGIDVKVDDLFFNKKVEESDIIQDQYWYLCRQIGGRLGTGEGPEFQKDKGYDGTHNIESILVKDIKNLDLLPKEVRDLVYSKFVN
ncbi:MAG: MutT/nudix family phosphohydrolase [Candidatus Jorgensenbacteria bacterium GW2011_GWA1_48_11]|uniref:8-oxo-dGTP diphosphatase n=1 Tax=Candidatus Jorgensenbacteria bacterium GW2011_GWA1_48_11 TaxID=1618660 RepID=A0A0G1X8V0_9BACT|nr:MAG: MutT/nudix family phosphohydrolase [Candidatus Jorgensenbacteria bacterium GW2011_GWA1_48_11]